jgi:hypothetical protein
LTYPCACCGYRTLTEPPGSHEICPVCRWEDDVYQLRWPDRAGGANKLSLVDAQTMFASNGPVEDIGREDEPADRADFEREPGWRPISAGRDSFEPYGGPLAPWPHDRTVLYWWRRRPATPPWWTEVAPVGLVRAVAAVAPPADGDNLSGMVIDFDHYLWRCPSIEEVIVTSSGDPSCQLTARCRAAAGASLERVAADIEQVWLSDLRYGYWEAHLLRTTAVSVELDVVTRISAGGYYITGRVIAAWAAGRHPGGRGFRSWLTRSPS